MSRSISEPIEPEQSEPEISNAEIYELNTAIFFSLEEIHQKIDAISKHLAIQMPTNTGESPEN